MGIKYNFIILEHAEKAIVVTMKILYVLKNGNIYILILSLLFFKMQPLFYVEHTKISFRIFSLVAPNTNLFDF